MQFRFEYHFIDLYKLVDKKLLNPASRHLGSRGSGFIGWGSGEAPELINRRINFA
ncbi:hypothetical protein [Neobacillus cucumis]|uniref:hypothetical protein n=1 Tax=Neobacillus cucumis TaxID=1740721 RepID=UPI001C60F12F|nr:hypothetical protein [Neobacillus cucumis]